MKRIVLLYLGRKGAGPMYSLEMAKALCSNNNNTTLLTIVSEYAENIESWESLVVENPNIKLIKVNTYRSNLEFILKTLNLKCFFNIRAAIKEFNPDILYSTMTHFWDLIIFFLCPPKVRKIKTIHDPILHSGENGIIKKFFHSLEFKQSDKTIVLSKCAFPELKRKGIQTENVIYIPHANFGGYMSKEYSPIENISYRILFLGRISKYKGLGLLLEAMRLVAMIDPRICLVVAGHGDCSEYAPLFNELASNLELHIRWINDNEIEGIVNSVDFLVLPYLDSSQSGIIPLAYAFGRPVIATKVGGLTEQVVDSTGILVEPNNPIALANAITSMYINCNIPEMGRCAQEYAHQNLTWESSARIFLNSI